MTCAPLAIPSDPTTSPEVLDRLRDALSGVGPLLLPHAPTEAPEVPEAAVSSVSDGGIAVGTSGSTGAAKRAVLSPTALAASADATHARLGGPGRWLLALPPYHIAGLQILLRTLRAGFTPAVVPPGSFTPEVFASGVRSMTGDRRYSSLVPTQLRRVLADPDAVAAARDLDAILVGGSAVDPGLLTEARERGLRIVVTYGMSETAGGCVYDGLPLDGVRVHLSDAANGGEGTGTAPGTGADPARSGRIHLTGPMLASGYLVPPPADPFVEIGGERWFRTDDLGHLDAGRLAVDGRADDVVISGGLKVWPAEVASRISDLLPTGCDVVAVGVPDAEWGQRIAVAIEAADGTVDVGDLLARAHEVLPRQARPVRVRVLEAIPRRGPGKPDRAALVALLS